MSHPSKKNSHSSPDLNDAIRKTTAKKLTKADFSKQIIQKQGNASLKKKKNSSTLPLSNNNTFSKTPVQFKKELAKKLEHMDSANNKTEVLKAPIDEDVRVLKHEEAPLAHAENSPVRASSTNKSIFPVPLKEALLSTQEKATETNNKKNTSKETEDQMFSETKKRADKTRKNSNRPRHKKSFKSWAPLLLVLLALCFTLFYTFQMWFDQDSIEVNFYSVSSKKIVNPPVRTVIIADLHQKNFGTNNEILLQHIRDLKPDFISVVGDMVTYQKADLDFLTIFCDDLVNIAPVYFALGNHEINELYYNKAPIIETLKSVGVHVLHDTVEQATFNGNLFSIGGLSRQTSQIKKYAPKFMDDFMQAEGYRLLLTHYPENFDGFIENDDYDLALAGHAHGGQVILPLFGAMYTRDQGLFPKLTEGLHAFKHGSLIISRGLGNSSPLPRINNKPELVVIDIE